MTDRLALIAYLATLGAICFLVSVAAVLAYHGRYSEAIGVGAAVTGLIGVIKLPSSGVDSQRSANTGAAIDLARKALAATPPGRPTGTPDDPIHTQEEAP